MNLTQLIAELFQLVSFRNYTKKTPCFLKVLWLSKWNSIYYKGKLKLAGSLDLSLYFNAIFCVVAFWEMFLLFTTWQEPSVMRLKVAIAEIKEI